MEPSQKFFLSQGDLLAPATQSSGSSAAASNDPKEQQLLFNGPDPELSDAANVLFRPTPVYPALLSSRTDSIIANDLGGNQSSTASAARELTSSAYSFNSNVFCSAFE
jgi:hypothetical protein